jgi:predicted hotdog family 3-hydroxylacyl-ACP dehydratase
MSPRSISADEIYARIPHSGAMRLLDAVLSWDDQSIVCSASSHVDPANPLRDNGVISSVHALEYAAQAMAVHGSMSRRFAAWKSIRAPWTNARTRS